MTKEWSAQCSTRQHQLLKKNDENPGNLLYDAEHSFPSFMIHLIAIGGYMQTHVLGIIFALVATYFIGSMWHGPLFGKLWMELNNIPMPKKEDMKFSMMLPGLSANFAMVILQCAVLGRTFQIVQLDNIGQALLIATIIWLPFSALLLANIYAWSGRSFKVWLLDAAHAWISILAVAAILYATL